MYTHVYFFLDTILYAVKQLLGNSFDFEGGGIQMSLSPAEISKIFDECDREEKETVSERIIKDVMEKTSAMGWPMHKDNILINWHFGFAVIDFVHKPFDCCSILTPKRIWLEGGTDGIYEWALKNRFSKN